MRLKFSLLFLTILSALTIIAAPPVEEGKAIFTSRCAACHNINKTLTGPALAGVDQRHSLDWIINFVHSSQTMVKNGDKDAVALFNKFNNIPMPDHGDLSDAQIKNIVEYIKTEARPAEEEKAPFAAPFKLRPNYTPLATSNYGFFLTLFSIIALLIVTLLFAVRVKEYEKMVTKKD